MAIQDYSRSVSPFPSQSVLIIENMLYEKFISAIGCPPRDRIKSEPLCSCKLGKLVREKKGEILSLESCSKHCICSMISRSRLSDSLILIPAKLLDPVVGQKLEQRDLGDRDS